MDNYDKYEEEINIFTLLWFVISKWKCILIVAIIGLVLGAGYAVTSSAPSDSATDTESNVVEEESKVSEYNLAKQTYEAGKARVESLERYMTESAIMDINPYELYKGAVTYVIDGEQKKLIGVNACIYSYVYDGALMSDLIEVGPYTTQELEKLIGVNQNGSGSVVLNENTTGQTYIRISIMAQNEQETEALLAKIETSLNDYLNTLQSQNNITMYTFLASEIKTSSSTELAEYQASMRSKYNEEKTNLETYKSAMENKEESVDLQTERGISKTTLIKYSGGGFAGGIVLAVIIWILIYFFCDRLYTVPDRERRFGVKQLGTVYNFEKLKSVDLRIAHKLGGVYSKLPLEEQKKVVLLNIKNELKKIGTIKKVFLVSSLGDALDETLSLKKGLEEAGYLVDGCENIIGRADVLKRVSLCDTAIVIENNKNSRANLIEIEINILKEYVGTILGMVIVENKV